MSWAHWQALPSFIIDFLHYDVLSIFPPSVSGPQGFKDADVLTDLEIEGRAWRWVFLVHVQGFPDAPQNVRALISLTGTQSKHSLFLVLFSWWPTWSPFSSPLTSPDLLCTLSRIWPCCYSPVIQFSGTPRPQDNIQTSWCGIQEALTAFSSVLSNDFLSHALYFLI